MIIPTSDTTTVAEMIEAWKKEDREEGHVPFSFEDKSKEYTGRGQEARTVDELDIIDYETDEFRLWPIVGLDNRVYEMRRGLIECLAAAKLPKDDPEVFVKKIDWDKFPSEVELGFLYETFFKQYDREVVMLVGWRRDGSGFRYHVPWQEGTVGLVKWKADNEEMGQFQEECSWVGTIHVHPGNSSVPSQTDIDDWAIPEKSGLHLIFGKDGSYSIHGAIAGRTFEVGSGPAGFQDSSVERLGQGIVTTSRDRPLVELLTRPKPVVTKSRKKRVHVKRGRVPGRATTHPWVTDVKQTKSLERDAVHTVWTEGLDDVGALDVEYEDAMDLSVVMTAQGLHILTPEQWELLDCYCQENDCPVPARRNLTLRGGGL